MEPLRNAGPVEADAEVFVCVKERQMVGEREFRNVTGQFRAMLAPAGYFPC